MLVVGVPEVVEVANVLEVDAGVVVELGDVKLGDVELGDGDGVEDVVGGGVLAAGELVEVGGDDGDSETRAAGTIAASSTSC